jgi:hypothetical protein
MGDRFEHIENEASLWYESAEEIRVRMGNNFPVWWASNAHDIVCLCTTDWVGGRSINLLAMETTKGQTWALTNPRRRHR